MPDKFVAWRNAYNAEKYDRVGLMLPAGQKEKIKEHVQKHGYRSINDFVFRAINKLMEDDEAAEK